MADAAAAQATADGKVSKNGDTVSGSLTFESQEEAIDSISSVLPINAREVIIPESIIYRDIQFTGKDGGRFGFIRNCIIPDTGERRINITAVNDKNAPYGSIDLIYDLANTGKVYAACPYPRENTYANDIDTVAASINRHPLYSSQNVEVYIDSNDPNASDTANLYEGRGSEALPFKTLMGAINYLTHYHSNTQAIVWLKSDVTYPGSSLVVPFNLRLFILSKDSHNPVTVTMTNTCNILKGVVCLAHAKWKAASPIERFFVTGFYAGESILEFDNGVVLEGTVNSCAVWAKQNGTIIVTTAPTGEVVGRRYICTNGGRILTLGKGSTAIPGTTEGTCDAGSLYY